MPSAFDEDSAHDNLAQAQYEEMMEARVLNQAKAVYNEYQFQDCKFDVVISHHDPDDSGNTDLLVASLIVYDAACHNKHNTTRGLKILLRSEAWKYLEGTYESLIDVLRVKMTTTLS
ncbi:hypothetical protein AA0112_g7438 [Alternaria arborescens]|uniref:hypothetical protein n=1 Tax=Alternaria arborescens TaxID=156630 RepID=UPI001074F347|nr:hypothetical protein AA0111_g7948 [Alternaria arborescens]RYN28432.1 hypothetical protein AA0112_g7438 [Alternaria arborescens]RYO26604.1 hypothetical protein AA0111_g7948 [Alternaria arborescens]